MVPLTTKKENPLFFLPQSSQPIKNQRGRRAVGAASGGGQLESSSFCRFLILRRRTKREREKEKERGRRRKGGRESERKRKRKRKMERERERKGERKGERKDMGDKSWVGELPAEKNRKY